MVYLLAGIIWFSAVSDSIWHDKTEIQSKIYLENVLSNNETFSINFWALSEVYFSDCKIHLQINDGLQHTRLEEWFKPIDTCNSTHLTKKDEKLDLILSVALAQQNVELLAYYITQVENLNKIELDTYISGWKISKKDLQLLQTIIKRESITEDILGFNEHKLIHLGLLIGPYRNQYLGREYLQNAAEIWTSQLEINSMYGNLEIEIILANVISAAFMLYDDATILKYGNDFLNSLVFPNSLIKVKRFNAIDYSNYIYGNYDKSLEIQRNYSLPLLEFLNEEQEKNKVLLRHGAYLFTLGKYSESTTIYKSLLNSDLNDKRYTILNNLSINYLKLGQNKKYITLQLDALQQKIENYKSLLNIYRNLFIYYSSIKDINTALTYIEKAKVVAQSNNDLIELARIESFLGTFYWSTFKDYEKSLTHFNIAESVLSAGEHYEAYRDLLLGKSEIYLKIDSLNAAQKTLDKLHNLTLSKSDTPAYLHTLILASNFHLKMNQPDSAKADLKEILMHSLDYLDFETVIKYHTTRSAYLFQSGDLREAIENLSPVIDQILQRTKSNTDTQAGFWKVEDEYLDAFELMVQLYRASKAPEKALVLLDQLKTINDAYLYNSPLIKAAKLTENELAEEKRLNDQIQDLRKKYLNANEEERFILKIEIDRASAKREEILNRVDLNKSKTLAPIWAIQNKLQNNEMVLHFTELGNQLFVSSLTSNSIQIRDYILDKNEIEHLTSVADNIAMGKTDLNDLYQIYEALNLKDIPSGIDHLTVIPDNYLYRIPLDILPTEEPASAISYGSSKYLIEDYHIRYFTSLQEFESNSRMETSDNEIDFAVFAISNFENFTVNDLPSLPYATEEARSIFNNLQSFQDKNIFIGQEASKKQFLKSTSNSKIVHVATHSEISEQNPLFSTIYLENKDGDPSTESVQALYAYELFETTLSSDFIMLNSCSSGSGNYMQGTGIMGISRALRYAGAKSLALNLWSVNDKVAAEFAGSFYSYIDEGFTKSEAIRKAKLDQLSTANANPHFWGAYMMIGNPTPLTGKGENANMLYIALISILIATGYSARRFI